MGDLLLLIGFGFEALYTLLGASSAKRFPPLALIVATNAVGLLFWTPAAVISMNERNWVLPRLDLQGLAALLYLVIVCSVIGYAVWFKTLRHAEASMASVTLFVQPLSGSLVGFLLLGEVFGLFSLVGGGLVVVSLGLIAFSANRKTTTTEEAIGLAGSAEYVALGASAALSEKFGQTLEQAISSIENLEGAESSHEQPPSHTLLGSKATGYR